MKWFRKLDDGYKALLGYYALVLIGLLLYGLYTLADKLIDKL